MRLCFVCLWIAALAGTASALPITDGLVLYLDAGEIEGVADGSSLAVWPDLSGQGNDATQSDAGIQPIYIASSEAFGGQPVVRFNGQTTWMALNPTMINVGSFTMFAVGQFNETTANQYIVAGQDGSGNDRIRFAWDAASDVVFEFRAGSSGWKNVTAPADTEIHTFAITSTVEGFLDGASLGTAANTSTENPTAFNIGSYNRGEKDFYDGDLAILVVYNRVLTDEEIAELSDFLMNQALTAEQTAVSNPYPANGASDVWPGDLVLSWSAWDDSQGLSPRHRVSLSDAFADVNEGLVLPVELDVNSLVLDTPLAYGTTYYWRVDEANSVTGWDAGPIWSFTTEPFARQIETITATASSSDTGLSPENLVNGAGLDENGLHSTLDTTMWLSGKNAEQPAWVQFEFDQVYKLHEMWVWNYNIALESVLGAGCKDVTVEYSTDGTDWMLLGDIQFARGAASPGYAHNTTVDFDGAAAKYVRLTPLSNWGGFVPQYGLSEVSFFYIPVQARLPVPASGTEDVDPRTLVLSWRPGREAASHMVFLGDDEQGVIDGTASSVTTEQASYAPASVELGATYYWKVVEVNEAEIPAAWDSAVWDFTTLQYIPIDDFDDYTNDSPNRVFQTWIDGLGFSPDEFFPNGNTGNGTGAIVGYDPQLGDIMETANAHAGQAMPLAYDNTSTKVSEAQRTWATGQDWTAYGADTLRLYVRGAPVGLLEIADDHILMNGIGTDIYASPDQGRFVYKQLSGNGSIVARVERIDETDPWAKACVMIRRALDATAPWAMAVYAPGNGFRFQTRATMGGAGASDSTVATAEQIAVRAPVWIKIERVGNQFNAYYATADAPTTWIASPWGAQTVEMTDPVYIGLAVTSHSAAAVTQAEFSNIATTGNVTGQWQSADLGIEQPAGNVSDPLYVTLEDTSNGKATVVNADPMAVTVGVWTPWEIPLTEFSSRGVETDSIKKMTIGIGDAAKGPSGATGTIYIDDIGYGRQ